MRWTLPSTVPDPRPPGRRRAAERLTSALSKAAKASGYRLDELEGAARG